MTLLIAALIVVLVVAVFVVWGRTWLKAQPWGWSQRFFAWIEPLEIALWKKSETILWSRFLMLIGILAPLLQLIGAIDLTPYMAIIPPEYGPYCLVLVYVCGQVGEWLRNRTTKPIEMVAVPDNAPASVTAPMQKADAAKEVAVAAIKEEGIAVAAPPPGKAE